MSDKVVVRFLKAWRGYSVDELAGFDPEVVEGLKAKGFAEVYEGEAGAAAKTKSPKSSGAKAGGAKSGGKAGSTSALLTNPTTPSGDGGEGEAGAGGEGGDDDEAKP